MVLVLNKIGHRSAAAVVRHHFICHFWGTTMMRTGFPLRQRMAGSSFHKKRSILQLPLAIVLTEHQARRADEHQDGEEDMEYFS